jgi:hypothetical protein
LSTTRESTIVAWPRSVLGLVVIASAAGGLRSSRSQALT